MKKSLPILAAALLTMATTVPFLQSGVAYADDGAHAKAGAKSEGMLKVTFQNDKDDHSVNATALLTMLSTLTNSAAGAQTDKPVKHHGKAKGKDEAPTPAGEHKAQLNQLHQYIDQLHKDIQAEQSAHKQLVEAAKKYVSAMQQAMKTNNTLVLTAGNTGIKSILASLQGTLATQTDEDHETEASMKAGKDGDLTSAFKAVQAADARMQAKTQQMSSLANALDKLVAQLTAELNGHTTLEQSSGTTSSTGTNSSVSNEGNVTVTVTDGSN